MSLNEPTFLISTLLPFPIEMFPSTLNAPSRYGSATPIFSTKSAKTFRKIRTCFGVSKSGSVTISTRGVPALL